MDGESPVRWTEAVKVLRYEYVPEEKDWACWLSMPIEFQEQDQAIFLKDFTWKAVLWCGGCKLYHTLAESRRCLRFPRD
jgi:hypothetical protein